MNQMAPERGPFHHSLCQKSPDLPVANTPLS
jgi:hypothetical protein